MECKMSLLLCKDPALALTVINDLLDIVSTCGQRQD